jgi:hypothetical protein
LPQAVKALLEAGADILQVVAHLMVVVIYQLIRVRKLTLVLPPCILQLGRLVRPTFTFGTASIPNLHPPEPRRRLRFADQSWRFIAAGMTHIMRTMGPFLTPQPQVAVPHSQLRDCAFHVQVCHPRPLHPRPLHQRAQRAAHVNISSLKKP